MTRDQNKPDFVRQDRTSARKLTETVETRRLAQSSSGIPQKMWMEHLKSLRLVKQSHEKFFGKTSCEVLVECKPPAGSLPAQPGQHVSPIILLPLLTTYAHKRFQNSAYPEKLRGLRDQIRRGWNQPIAKGNQVQDSLQSQSWVRSDTVRPATRQTAKQTLRTGELTAVAKTNRARVATRSAARKSSVSAARAPSPVPKPATKPVPPRRAPAKLTPVRVEPIKKASPQPRIRQEPRPPLRRPIHRARGGGRSR